MSATVLLVAIALGQTPADKPVTEAEKKEFMNVLFKLPHEGKRGFTEEAITTAVPYTRVLLSLSEQDLKQSDLYPFLVLSSALMDRKEPREYAIAHFRSIAHPVLKLAWGYALFARGHASPEIVKFLYKALESEEQVRELSRLTGPNFNDFRERLTRAYETARLAKVELVRRHSINAMPEHGRGFHYTRESLAFAPERMLYAVRPLQEQGELIEYNVAKGTSRRLAIPQAQGVQALPGVASYFFRDPVLSVNSAGDLLVRWTIRGNGDHGLALRKKGADSFRVGRADLALADCLVIAEPAGDWFLVQGGPHFTVHQVDQDLKLTRLGDFSGRGHDPIRIVDARFISKDTLHLFWADVLPSGNHLRMRCIDFDVKKRTWLHDREAFRLEQFVSSASEPTLLQLTDKSLHYLWKVDEGANPGQATGLYYQAEADGKTVKLSRAYHHRAVGVGNRVVICFTLENQPDKVSFFVIRHGIAGPVTEIEVAKGREHNLSSEDMVLFANGDRIWFVNTLASNTLYELRLVESQTP